MQLSYTQEIPPPDPHHPITPAPLLSEPRACPPTGCSWVLGVRSAAWISITPHRWEDRPDFAAVEQRMRTYYYSLASKAEEPGACANGVEAACP